MRDLVLAGFWAGALPLALLNPAAGPIFWLWDAIMSPTELMYGFMAPIPTNKIIAIVTICALFFGRDKDIFLDRVLMFLLLLTGVATLSYLQSISEYPGDLDLYLKLVKEVVFVFVFSWLVIDQRWLETALFALVIAISFLGVKEGLISVLTAGGHKIVGSRALGDNNQLAAALDVTLPILLFLSQRIQSGFVKVGLYIVMALNITTVIMTFSRGGFIGLLVVLFFVVKGSKHKFKAILLTISLCLAILLLAPSEWFNRVDTIQSADGDGSFIGRVIAWKISWLIAQDNPFVGGGPHAVQHWDVWGHYFVDLYKLSFIPTPGATLQPKAAHSIYFEILGDLGFTGLLLFLTLFYMCLSYCKSIMRTQRHSPSTEWACDLAGHLRVSFVAYLITGALLSIAYQELLYILIAFTVSLHRIMSVNKRPPDNAFARSNVSSVRSLADLKRTKL